jgi:predicted acetyltransferase
MGRLDVHPASADEIEALRPILSQCFNMPPATFDQYRETVGAENFRVAVYGRTVVAGLALYPMGMWLGGRSVPLAGVAAVGVPPENRGHGMGFALMRGMLAAERESGAPLSSLYASTQVLYRRVGYEQAGHRCGYSFPLAHAQVAAREMMVSKADPTDHALFKPMYRTYARRQQGMLDRNDAIWSRVTRGDQVFAAILGDPDEPEGYIVFQQVNDSSGYRLHIRDKVALTPAAQRQLWTYLADHRSMADQVRWWGAANDPFLHIPAESYVTKMHHFERWMVRVVHPTRALEERGYPAGVSAQLHLSIHDDVLPVNSGPIVLDVGDGRARVRPGGRSEITMSARGLAPLFTGMWTPQQLRTMGLLEGTDRALADAARVFASPEPWMPDHY